MTARHDWTRARVAALFELPFMKAAKEAQRLLERNFPPQDVAEAAE